MTETFSFPRYLAAKRTVDDRALNRQVWDALAAEIGRFPRRTLRILEIGAGIGTMFERMVEWGALDQPALDCVVYYAIDAQVENITEAARRLPKFAQARGWQVEVGQAGWWSFRPAGSNPAIDLQLEAVDLYDLLTRPRPAIGWDIIIAHAFLDLVNVPATLPQLRSLLTPGGLLYLTINFDGLTLLEPTIDQRLDDKIQALYHASMDERLVDGRPSGSSRTGRRMFAWLRQAGLEILEAGSSDWTVFARGGQYPAEEAYFLRFILHFFEDALSGHPELADEPFADWLLQRRKQIERGELVYIAHQMDFLAKGI